MTSHIFLLDTELQCYASLKVIETEHVANPVFFSFNPNVHRYLEQTGHQAMYLQKKSKGLFRQTRALHKSINAIKKHLSDKNIIYVHRLDLIYTNIVIGTLSKKFNIEVRIVPEGTLNYSLEDVSVKWLRRSKKWPPRICYGLTGLRKFEIQGERVGVDMPIVSTAYSFAGLKSPYPKEKVQDISFFQPSNRLVKQQTKKALVVGQSILNNKRTPKEYETRISDKIQTILTSLGINEIDYIAHPRDKNACLLRDNYQVVKHPYICLEQYLEKNDYDILISCCSTALVTAKLIFGDKIESIAVGTNVFPTNPDSTKSFNDIFKQSKVKTIDL